MLIGSPRAGRAVQTERAGPVGGAAGAQGVGMLR